MEISKKKKKSQLLERRADINILLTSIPMISQLLRDVIHKSINVTVDSINKKGRKIIVISLIIKLMPKIKNLTPKTYTMMVNI